MPALWLEDVLFARMSNSDDSEYQVIGRHGRKISEHHKFRSRNLFKSSFNDGITTTSELSKTYLAYVADERFEKVMWVLISSLLCFLSQVII
jgi:hypothetical protein